MQETIKKFSLLEEFQTSEQLIRLGFGELQNINFTNHFYFLPFQLLSQGFERLLKAYICAVHFDRHNAFPDFKYLLKLGHDLDKLLKEVIDNYLTDYKRHQFAIDKEFLTENDDFLHLLYIISEFGKHARYYNFDVITNSSKPSINTIELWNNFENKLIQIIDSDYSRVSSADVNVGNEIYAEISRYVIIIFEKFVAAIARQIIFDGAGDLAKQLTVANIFDFGLLYEKDYGNRDYRTFTTKYKESPRKKHKRTLLDNVIRKWNPKIKYKTIRKEDYHGDWPFYSDSVTIECRQKIWCLITIDGYLYALNGSAKGRYKLDNPHDAGMAILGKSIGEFITIARNL